MENSKLVGFVSGADFDNGKWLIKKLFDGKAAGLKMSTSHKPKDGERVYGQDIQITCYIDNGAEDVAKLEQLIGSGMLAVEGYFKGEQWKNKEGTVVKSFKFVTNLSKIRPANTDAPTQSKAEEVEEMPW